MSDQTKLPPIIEPWRIVAIIMAVAIAMMFVHSITPTRAEEGSRHLAFLWAR